VQETLDIVRYTLGNCTLYIPNKTLTALTDKVGSIGDVCGLYLGRARFECQQRHANVTSGSRGFNQYIQVRLEITLRTLPCRLFQFIIRGSHKHWTLCNPRHRNDPLNKP